MHKIKSQHSYTDLDGKQGVYDATHDSGQEALAFTQGFHAALDLIMASGQRRSALISKPQLQEGNPCLSIPFPSN